MKKSFSKISIVLLSDQPGLGAMGEIVDVKPGYARNYLIPKKIAVFLNDPKAKEILLKRKTLQKEDLQNQQDLKAKIENIAGKKLIFSVKVNAKGNPYKAIQVEEIAQKLNLNKNLIKTKPIRKLGETVIEVRDRDQKVKIKVVLAPEK